MPRPSRYLIIALLAFAFSCATSSPAPPDWTPTPNEATTRVFGHWIIVTTAARERFSGELIAVGTDDEHEPQYVYIAREDQMLAVSVAGIRWVTLVEHKRDAAGGDAWVTLGSLSTVSHGGFLLLSIPGWLLAGGVPTALTAKKGVFEASSVIRFDDRIRKYARFPQGIPRSVLRGMKVEAR
jgi:hypothetical protein